MLMNMNNVLKMAMWCHEYNSQDNAVQRLAASMHWLGEGIQYGSNEARNAAILESQMAYRRERVG